MIGTLEERTERQTLCLQERIYYCLNLIYLRGSRVTSSLMRMSINIITNIGLASRGAANLGCDYYLY